LPSGYSLVGSALPATLTSAQGGITNAPISLPAIDGMLILTWDVSKQKYVQTGYDLGTTSAWVQGDGVTATTVPGYTIGQGFFYFNPIAAQAWKQSLP
jgi:hypothetical protein